MDIRIAIVLGVLACASTRAAVAGDTCNEASQRIENEIKSDSAEWLKLFKQTDAPQVSRLNWAITQNRDWSILKLNQTRNLCSPGVVVVTPSDLEERLTSFYASGLLQGLAKSVSPGSLHVNGNDITIDLGTPHTLLTRTPDLSILESARQYATEAGLFGKDGNAVGWQKTAASLRDPVRCLAFQSDC